MWHGLTGGRAVIRTHVEAIGMEALMQGVTDLACQRPYRRVLVRVQVEQPGAVPTRDHQGVTRGYGKAVRERQRVGVGELCVTRRHALTERTWAGHRQIVILARIQDQARGSWPSAAVTLRACSAR